MNSKYTETKDNIDLDTINKAIIDETFIADDPDGDLCGYNCFKWWFFYTSFQAPKESIADEKLLHTITMYNCCNVCGDCIELKIKKNCCSLFDNRQLSCCCFTFVSK
jgi:hypothetical protein